MKVQVSLGIGSVCKTVGSLRGEAMTVATGDLSGLPDMSTASIRPSSPVLVTAFVTKTGCYRPGRDETHRTTRQHLSRPLGRQATGETGWDGDRLAHNPATASVALLSGHDGGKYAAKSELRAVVGSTFTQVEAAVGIP